MGEPFTKLIVQQHFDHWYILKLQIERMFTEQDADVKHYVIEGVQVFRELLKDGGQIQTEDGVINKLYPLNGEERLQFIEQHSHLHHAFVQLSALFEETEKKAARLTITERRKN